MAAIPSERHSSTPIRIKIFGEIPEASYKQLAGLDRRDRNLAKKR